MAGGQPPTGRWVRTRDNLAKRVSRPPVPRQPVQRLLVSRPAPKDLSRDRQEYVKVERAGPALTDQCHGFFVARLDPLAKLPRENVTSLDRQAIPPTSRRHRAMKNVFFHLSVIDVPWDYPGSARGFGECRDIRCRPTDRQMVPEPGRCRSGRWLTRGRWAAGPVVSVGARRCPMAARPWPGRVHLSQGVRINSVKDRASRPGFRSRGRRGAHSRASCAGRDGACGA